MTTRDDGLRRQGLLLALLLGICGAVRADDASPAAAEAVRDPSLLVRLVRSKEVRRELQLSPTADREMGELVSKADYPLFLLRDVALDEKREKLESIANELEQGLKQLLSAEQQQRLIQIELRAQGWPAMIVPPQSQQLALDGDQLKTITQQLKDAAQGETSLQSADEKIQQLLQPQQRAALDRLLGPAFDLSTIPHVACRAPELCEVSGWINTEPLSLESLRGRVVVLHFFAFGCGNCVQNQPHYKAWHERYAKRPVTILGIHTPETERERDPANLQADVTARELRYPIAIDAQARNWAAWANRWWPSVYLIDRRGEVRYWWYGELNWKGAKGEQLTRQRIDELLAESD